MSKQMSQANFCDFRDTDENKISIAWKLKNYIFSVNVRCTIKQ